mgnify:CR=1 FL=1
MNGLPLLQSIFDETTEKTIEVNVLAELVRRFLPNYVVTILGPSRKQERELGFDDILEGLPPGYTFTFQFKKPFMRNDGCPRFTINIRQLQVLLDRFTRNEAFFVLCPFTRTSDLITAHRGGNLLQQSPLLDVHDIPLARKQTQKTRTLKYTGPGQIEVTDPRKYLPVEKTWSFEDLIKAVMEEKVGRKKPKKKEVSKEKKRRYGGTNYYIHIAKKEENNSSN